MSMSRHDEVLTYEGFCHPHLRLGKMIKSEDYGNDLLRSQCFSRPHQSADVNHAGDPACTCHSPLNNAVKTSIHIDAAESILQEPLR